MRAFGLRIDVPNESSWTGIRFVSSTVCIAPTVTAVTLQDVKGRQHERERPDLLDAPVFGMVCSLEDL